MKEEFDIHDTETKLQQAKLRFQKQSKISNNKKLAEEFIEHLAVTGISKGRMIRYLSLFVGFERAMKKDFEKVEERDIKKYITDMQSRKYSPSTIYTNLVTVKRFYKWLKGNDEYYPDVVKWLKPRIRKTDMKPLGEGDLITESDVKKMIEVANNSRDKALISLLYESGCRIGELASLQLKNVKFDSNGVVLTVQGKTGVRTVRVISSTPYLMTWLQCHPFRDDPNSAVWVGINNNKSKRVIHYKAFEKMIKGLGKKAGLKKKCNPHLFRHSRATQLANHLTELQMDKYFGWTFGSRMPSTYVHMSGRDLDASIFQLNGIRPEEKANKPEIMPIFCPRCNTINTYDAKFCKTCASALEVRTAMELEERSKSMEEANQIMANLAKHPDLMQKFVNALQGLSKA